jgi:bacteriocin biosynthesis cyclodehydratase domain-containing protein
VGPASDIAARRYRLAPGVEFAVVEGDRIVFRSEAVRVRLEGRSTVEFVERVVPLLDGATTVADVARQAGGLDPIDLDGHLAALADAGVIEQVEQHTDGNERAGSSPLHEMFEQAGRHRAQSRERVASTRFAVFGLESAGAPIALELARAGAGEIALVDPFPPRDDDPSQLGLEQAQTRQQAVARQLERARYAGRIKLPLDTAWDREAVAGIAAQADVLISAIDRDHAAVAHWVNRAAHAHQRIAAFASISGAKGYVGPVVFPQETPCFMCYRMRALATENEYGDAMALEEARDRRRGPAREREPTMLSVIPVVAGMLTGELLKALVAVGRHAAVARVFEWDGLNGQFSTHEVLVQPSCPVCGKKNS